MKRRLSDENCSVSENSTTLIATIREVMACFLSRENISTLEARSSRFGSVPFEPEVRDKIDTFLHQKLGKENLTRRPGPGGKRLTYIESCKAIELANRAFGFNGWSCHIIECKEEYRHQKGDRWSIGFSSLVRIVLRDGTSHEDVGFGQADGQRDLGAAIEQAKKASISDARKRALRLFGEHLGNSCYDREHIKDVLSNKAPALAPTSTSNFSGPSGATTNPQAMKLEPIINGRQYPLVQSNQINPIQNKQQPQVVQQNGQNAQQIYPNQQQVQHQMQFPPQNQPQQRQQLSNQHQRVPQAFQHQQYRPQQQHQQASPTVVAGSVAQSLPHPPQLQNNRQQQASVNIDSSNRSELPMNSSANASVNNISGNITRHPLQPIGNGYLPPRPCQITPILKKEHPVLVVGGGPQESYDMDDLSLSQFDYDPNDEHQQKRMRT